MVYVNLDTLLKCSRPANFTLTLLNNFSLVVKNEQFDTKELVKKYVELFSLWLPEVVQPSATSEAKLHQKTVKVPIKTLTSKTEQVT